MPICHKHKFIFLHIPRCGGTSIEQYFKLSQLANFFGVTQAKEQIITLHHLTLQDLIASTLLDKETAEGYFKFTIIRDPFDRMASDFLWQKRHDRHGHFSDMAFSDYLRFAEKIIQQGRYFDEVHLDHFRPMVQYCFEGNEMVVDDILLLEHINQELKRLTPVLGDITLPVINHSLSSYQELRTREHLAHVYEIYQADKQLHDSLTELQNQ